MSFTYKHPKADIAVDCVLFGFNPEHQWLEVVLIRRAEEPFKEFFALPGGFIRFLDRETAEDAAYRELREEAGVTVNYLEQLKTFDDPDRDPRGRTFSIAYYALVHTQEHITKKGSEALEACWVPTETALSYDLAFDHILILQTALARLRAKVRYEPIGFKLLPEKFTLSQLQKLYEAVLDCTLDRRNFRKRLRVMKGGDLLIETGEVEESNRSGPPAKLYRFDKEAYDKAVEKGFTFEI